MGIIGVDGISGKRIEFTREFLANLTILKFPNNYIEAVRMAVNITGDSDSIGCIAGGILGARLGVEAIPKTWISNLTEGDRLELVVQPLLQSKLN